MKKERRSLQQRLGKYIYINRNAENFWTPPEVFRENSQSPRTALSHCINSLLLFLGVPFYISTIRCYRRSADKLRNDIKGENYEKNEISTIVIAAAVSSVPTMVTVYLVNVLK